jgi:hypothetical protein
MIKIELDLFSTMRFGIFVSTVLVELRHLDMKLILVNLNLLVVCMAVMGGVCLLFCLEYPILQRRLC